LSVPHIQSGRSAHQIIIAADVTNQTNDKQQVQPILREARANIGEDQTIEKTNLDNGYYSEENVTWLEDEDIDGYLATGRLKYHEVVPANPAGPMPED
jgi:hypothetical protein